MQCELNEHQFTLGSPHTILTVLLDFYKSLSIAGDIEWAEHITHSSKVISIPATALKTCPYHPDTAKLQERHIYLIQSVSFRGKQKAKETF